MKRIAVRGEQELWVQDNFEGGDGPAVIRDTRANTEVPTTVQRALKQGYWEAPPSQQNAPSET